MMAYMFMTIGKVKNIQTVLSVYNMHQLFTKQCKDRFPNYQRIADYDNITLEMLYVFVTNLITNTFLKYKSSKENRRQDAMTTAKLASVMIRQFLDPKKHHSQQFEIMLNEINTFVHKKKKEPGFYVEQHEIDFYTALTQKHKSQENESIRLLPDLPDLLLKQLDRVDQSDCSVFVEGIDTESVAYNYFNSLNQFRYEFQAQISMHALLDRKGPFNESNFTNNFAKQQCKYPSILVEAEFNLESIFETKLKKSIN